MLNSSSSSNSSHSRSSNRRRTSNETVASTSSHAATSRPITRSFSKQQQQQMSQTAARNVTMTSPLSSRSSSSSPSSSLDSSIDSMDTLTNNRNAAPKNTTQPVAQLTDVDITSANDPFSRFGLFRPATGPGFSSISVAALSSLTHTGYQKIITDEKPANLICLVENAKISGRPVRNISNVSILYIENGLLFSKFSFLLIN